MRRLFVVLLTLCISAALFATGGSQSSTSGGGAAQPREIRVLLANHPYGDLLKAEIPNYERQTGMRVIMESLQETQLTQKLTTEFATGSSSVDVFMSRPLEETLLFNKNDWYAPLDAYDFSDYPANTVDIGRKNGRPHIVPIIIEWQVLYYRKDLLDRAGLRVPTNFTELENAARTLHSGDIVGFGSRGGANLAVTQVSSYIYNFGGKYMDNNVAVFDSPEAMEAFRYYGRLLGTYGPQGVTSMSWNQLMAIFQAGRLALWTDASVFYGQIINPENTQIPAENVGVAKLPAGPKGDSPFIVASWAMAISSKTRSMDTAMGFLNWATSRDMALKGMQANITMARPSVWSDPSIAAVVNPGLVESMLHASRQGYPYDRPFMSSVGRARDLIGEVIIETINTRGTSSRLQALATQKVGEVNDLLRADGEYGTR